MDDTTVCIHVTGLMFSAGHKNTTHATAKECVRKSKWWKQRGRERERRGDGGHSVDKAVLFLIYVLL